PQSKEFERHRSFTLRPRWSDHLYRFLTDSQGRSGYLLFVAGEGEGKSAFIADCIQDTIEPIFHFVRRTEPGWDDPERMLRSLTAQLCRKYPVTVNRELEDRFQKARSAAARNNAAAEILADVLERVSRIIVSEDEREVLWIDGLDEAFGPTGRYHG